MGRILGILAVLLTPAIAKASPLLANIDALFFVSSGSLKAFDPSTAQLTELLPPHGQITSFDYQPDTRRLLALQRYSWLDDEQRIVLMDLNSKRTRVVHVSTIPLTFGTPRMSEVGFFPVIDRGFVTIVANDSSVIDILNLANGQTFLEKQGLFPWGEKPHVVRDVGYFFFWTGGEEPSPDPSWSSLINLRTGRVEKTITFPKEIDYLQSFSPDGRLVVLMSGGDWTPGKVRRVFTFPEMQPLSSFSGRVAAWHPNKRMVLLNDVWISSRAFFIAQDAVTGKEVFRQSADRSWALDWRPNGDGFLFLDQTSVGYYRADGSSITVCNFLQPGDDAERMEGNRHRNLYWKNADIGLVQFYNDTCNRLCLFDLKSMQTRMVAVPIPQGPGGQEGPSDDRSIKVSWR